MADNTNTPSGNRKIPAGSLILESVAITSLINGNSIDLKAITYECSVYESILNPFMTADIYIADALALTSWLPIVGAETVTITFSRPDQSIIPMSVTMRVIGISDYHASNARTAGYAIHCASQEYIHNLNTKIQYSYREMPISTMVEEICNNDLKTSKELDMKPSDGMRTIVIPNLHPNAAIKFLCREAKSADFEASNFMFFETRKGFHFTTLDELISERPTDKYFTQEKDVPQRQSGPASSSGGRGRTNIKPTERTKIDSFNFINLFALDKSMAMGAFENTNHFIDPIYSRFDTVKYNYFEDRSKLKSLTVGSAGKVLPENTDVVNQGQSMVNFFMTANDGANVDTDQKAEFFHLVRGSAGLLDSIVVDITVPGDTDRIAGETIELEFPEFGATDDVRGEINRMISGEYLVVSVRHMYSTAGAYKCHMQCVKNCYERDVETIEAKRPSFLPRPRPEPQNQTTPPLPRQRPDITA